MKKVLLIFILSQFYLCCIGRNSDTISVLNDFKGTWVITKNYYEINRPAAYLLTKKE